MGKKMWGVAVFLFVIALLAGTLYFENSIESVKRGVEASKSQEKNTLQTQTFKPLENEDFVVVKEEESDAIDEGSVSEEPTWVYGEVVIEEEISPEEFLIVLEYSNIKNTPLAAVCYTPELDESFTATSINENMSGEIIFKPQTFEKGVWYLVLNTNESLGTYTAYGISVNAYNSIKNPIILKPRDLDAPGALLPDE